MKYFYTFLFTVCSLLFANGQEDIRSTVIDDTNLLISAKASSVSNVTFTIEPSIDHDKDNVGFKFPIIFKVSPFNAQTFQSKFMDYLEKLYEYQEETVSLDSLSKLINKNTEMNEDQEIQMLQHIKTLMDVADFENYFGREDLTSEKLKDGYGKLNSSQKKELKKFIVQTASKRIEIFKKEIIEKLKQVIDDSPNKDFKDKDEASQFLENKANIRKRIERLFAYFDAQIVLLFKYDTEPVAGTLNYNLDNIEVQYFDNRSYETYFENRKRNYHDLIRKLYRLRLHSEERLINKAEKTQSPLTEEYVLSDILKKDSVLVTIGKNIVTKILENDSTLTNKQKEIVEKVLKQISFISEDEKNMIKNILKKNSDNSFITKADKEVIEKNLKARFNMNDLKNVQLLTIIDHFSKDAREYKSKYIENPALFLDHFEDIINNFRIYHPSKRKSLIYQKLLELKNRESYDDVCIELHKILPFQNELNNLHDIVDGLDKEKLELNDKISSLVSKKDSLNKELTTTKNKIQNLNKLNNLKKQKKKKETEKDFLAIFQLILKISKDFPFINLNHELLSKIDKVIANARQKELRVDLRIKELKTGIAKFKDIQKNDMNILKNKEIDESNLLNAIKGDIIDKNSRLEKKKEEISEKYKSISNKNKLINNKLLKISENYQNAPLWNFDVDDIKLDINDGFIEGITVVGRVKMKMDINFRCDENLQKKLIKIISEKSFFNQELKFKNSFPFGFSSSKDFDDFKNYELCVYVGRHKQFTLKVKDIFPEYIEGLQNDRLDYSPKDQVVKIERAEENTTGKIILKKEKSSKLFTIAVYTDFVGMKDNESNGILQFEFEKMMPLYTKRNTWRFGERYISRGLNYGYFNFIKPQFRWARLDADDNSKNLKLETLNVFQGNTSETIKYVTLLDLFRFENISVGADLNLLSVDLPTAKTRFEINFGGRYGRTRVLDTNGNPNITETVDGEEKSTIVNTYEINTWRFYPEFTFRLRPEERYGASVSFRPIRYNTDTRDFSSVTSAEEFTNTLTDRELWLHQVEINAYFAPSSQRDNTFFFRYRYTNNSNWQGNGFGEIQVGYSMALKL